jgi:hypothetical protein
VSAHRAWSRLYLLSDVVIFHRSLAKLTNIVCSRGDNATTLAAPKACVLRGRHDGVCSVDLLFILLNGSLSRSDFRVHSKPPVVDPFARSTTSVRQSSLSVHNGFTESTFIAWSLVVHSGVMVSALGGCRKQYRVSARGINVQKTNESSTIFVVNMSNEYTSFRLTL